MSDAIYFIDPSNRESIKGIIDDFPPDDEDEFDFDTYGNVHICFNSTF